VAVASPMTTVALTLTVAVTVALGVLPNAVLDLANKASFFVQ
jgi:NADH-quinone oxidoreductase subunit N